MNEPYVEGMWYVGDYIDGFKTERQARAFARTVDCAEVFQFVAWRGTDHAALLEH